MSSVYATPRSSSIVYPTSSGRGRFWGAGGGGGRSGPPTSFMSTSSGNFATIDGADTQAAMDFATEWVMSWWMRRGQHDFGAIIGSRLSSPPAIEMAGNGGGVRYDITATSTARGSVSTDAVFTDGDWHHYALWFRGGQQLRLWVDGSELTMTNISGASPSAWLPVLGAGSGWQIGPATMDIAEIAMWNGPGYTAADLANIYTGALSGTYASPTLYRSLADATGMTLTGSPTFT